ncbi:MAG: DUF4328 domain-containing protein [Myxococcota bacterium]
MSSPNESAARLLQGLLLINIAVSAATVPTDFFIYQLENSTSAPMIDILSMIVLVLGATTIGGVLIFLVTGIVWLVWMHGARKFLDVIEPDAGRTFSTGGVVWSWFVPFANLIWPYQAMEEIWIASDVDGADMMDLPEGEYDNSFLRNWWAFWIGTGIFNNFYSRLSLREAFVSETTVILGVISGLLGVASAWTALQVVRRVERRQARAVASLEQWTME